MSDFKITAYATVVFTFLEIFMRKVAYIFFEPFCKEQTDLKLREVRSSKAAHCIHKTLYFIFAVGWGYTVLKDQEYFPPYLGGSGDIDKCFNGYPYSKHAD